MIAMDWQEDDPPVVPPQEGGTVERTGATGAGATGAGATGGLPAGATASSDTTPPDELPVPPVAAASEPKEPSSYYDLWVMLPAIVAILLAVFTRQVVPALVVGVLTGAYMIVPCLPVDDVYGDVNPIVAGFRLAAERYVLGAITDTSAGFGHIKIMVFTLVIGFMIGVIGRNGGTKGMVKLVVGNTNSPRRGALTAWLAGLVVFFDDYANTMIVGPTMRSVFDRLRLSRAKLAYIVDSTAAPVASIALIGTWIGAEIGYIQVGLDAVAESGAPAFLANSQGELPGGMQAFISSLPYRFYPILALLLVFLTALTGRDIGPMKRSEREAAGKREPEQPSPSPLIKGGPQGGSSAGPWASSEESPSPYPLPAREEEPAKWWLGFFPVAVLVLATVVILVLTGYSRSGGHEITQQQTAWWQRASQIVSAGDSYIAIFYGAILSAIAGVLLTILARTCSMRDAVDAGLDGMARMFPALVILVLAWALSEVLQDLALGSVAVAHLRAIDFPAEWLPLAVFLCAAVISFATGSSWGTMGILCPATVAIGARLAADLEPAIALNIFYAAVGSVLAGAVFGDHCSPISDTTVLSSIAAGCRHEEHVWTQIPYALVAAVAAMGLGDVMCSVYKQPWYYGLLAGAVFLVLAVFIIGRRAAPRFEPARA